MTTAKPCFARLCTICEPAPGLCGPPSRECPIVRGALLFFRVLSHQGKMKCLALPRHLNRTFEQSMESLLLPRCARSLMSSRLMRSSLPAELWSLPAFLKFVLLEMLLDAARTLIRASDPGSATQVLVRLKSLSSIGQIDWEALIEPLIAFDATLRRDPAGKLRKHGLREPRAISKARRLRCALFRLHRMRSCSVRARSCMRKHKSNHR